MSLQQLSRQLEQDVDYLIWRAQTYQHSKQQLISNFSDLANSYRRLTDAKQQDQLEQLIANCRCRLL